MAKKQFIGFRNKKQLKSHIKEQFPRCKIKSIGKKKMLKGVTKTTPPTSSYMVDLKC